MKISSFNIMRAYRKNGRLVYILKLSLPCLEALQGESFDRFNAFYKSLASEYEKLVADMADEIETVPKRPNNFCVTYELIESGDGEEHIYIKRMIVNKSENNVFKAEEIDCYNALSDVFLKKPKNVNKQRKTP